MEHRQMLREMENGFQILQHTKERYFKRRKKENGKEVMFEDITAELSSKSMNSQL